VDVRGQVSQRDLRLRSRDIIDAVERGESFTVTRDGRPMGQLIPLRRSFITRAQFAAMARQAAAPDLDRFRADQEAALDRELDDPYAR
jgi:prevent-host-death family protein